MIDSVPSAGTGRVEAKVPADTAAWLRVDSACGALLVARDWSDTPLGPIARWSNSLKTMVGFVLGSRVPMVMLWGTAGTMIYNDAYSVFAGKRHPDLFGQDVRQGWSEVAEFNDNVMRIGLGGGTLSYSDQELTLFRNGVAEQVFMNLDYSPVPGDDGRPAGVLAIVIETTKRIEAERQRSDAENALVVERDRARGVLENMTEGFVLLDNDFRVIDINAEGLRLECRPADDIIGQSQWTAWPATAESEIGQLYRRAMADRVAVAREHQYRWPDGRTSWLDMRAYPTRDGLAVFYKDVTVRREAVDAAAAAAERVQLALDAGAIVGTWVWDSPTESFIVDERFATTCGLDPALCRAGVSIERVLASIHPEDRAIAASAIAAVLDRGGVYRCEYRVRQGIGSYRWIEANGRAELAESGLLSRFSGVLIDIDARRAAEIERDRATDLLRIFADAVPGVVYAKDREGRMLVGNRGTSELIGKPPSDYIGQTDLEILKDKDQARAIMATDRRIMQTGVTEQVEEDVRLADGNAAIWLSTKAPLRDANGVVIGLVGSSVDITARIVAERALDEALKTSDILLHEVNHRVKNSLQIVTSLLMLQANQAKDPALRKSLMDARSRIAVIADLHQRLYATSQHDQVDFGDYIRDLAKETFRSLEDAGRVQFEAEVESGISVALNQAVSLALVVNELVTNAIKYAFPDGRSGLVVVALMRAGENIELSVTDDGVGLPAGFEVAKRPTLGMRIVTSLVRQVRGTLAVRSTSSGTAIAISIPTDSVT